MRLKTYIVQNVSEALPMIKRDLGADAMILNTKKVKTGGFIGFFKKEKLEVIAAVETNPRVKKEAAEPVKMIQPKEKALKPAAAEVKAAVQPPPPVEDEKAANELITELKSIKQFMMQAVEEDQLPPSLKNVSKRLKNQEVTSELQADLMSKLISKMMTAGSRNQELTEQEVHALARKEMIGLIEDHQKTPEDKNPEIICFIGPTGVGKTTTIAKIAADYMLRGDKKVGLITSDTYRIAAVEQLKTYAGILNIPIKVVDSPADLNQAMEELSACDIVLMDTAGRNYQQKQYIDDLEVLLADKNKIQINLVLSLTSKYEDMRKIIDNFQTIKMDQLLLTKQDETSSSGAILNLIYHYSIPVTYIANGQNVPDDILSATPELIADFVLGEDDNA